MKDKESLLDLGSLIKEDDNQKNNPSLDLILNNLPFGISVQNKARIVIYENNKAKELTGSFRSRHCFNRWDHLPDEGKKICKDCPATISLIDHASHKVFRKTLDRNFQDLYLEIQVVPLMEKTGQVNRYIEIINDVSKDESIKPLVNKSPDDLANNMKFCISKYGAMGGEILRNDNLEFLDQHYIQKLTMFTYIGIFQNNFSQEGLFGPIPVLDIPAKLMLVYSFRVKSNISDPRNEGMEPCLLLIFIDRENYRIFDKRERVLAFLNSNLEKINILDLTKEWFTNFKYKFREIIIKLLNDFEFKTSFK